MENGQTVKVCTMLFILLNLRNTIMVHRVEFVQCRGRISQVIDLEPQTVVNEVQASATQAPGLGLRLRYRM